jgi:hypothetical protein
LTCLTSKTENAHLEVALVPIDQLRPHEKGSPLYLKLLRQEILRDGVLKYPIIAEHKSGVILDGMHRWLAIKSMGYALIPAVRVDAFGGLKIRVGRRRIQQYTNGSNGDITVEKVIAAGLTGQLMEPRSTRHFFPFSKFQLINCPLPLLKKGAPQDVSRYLSKMNIKESGSAIRQWLEEITEELEFLTKRKEEVEREKEEFLNRMNGLEKNISLS